MSEETISDPLALSTGEVAAKLSEVLGAPLAAEPAVQPVPPIQIDPRAEETAPANGKPEEPAVTAQGETLEPASENVALHPKVWHERAQKWVDAVTGE